MFQQHILAAAPWMSKIQLPHLLYPSNKLKTEIVKKIQVLIVQKVLVLIVEKVRIVICDIMFQLRKVSFYFVLTQLLLGYF